MKKIVLSWLLLFMSPVFADEPSYVLWNIDHQITVISNNELRVRPMASITKLMNVLVTLNLKLPLDDLIVVTGKERSSHIRPGMMVSRRSLIDLSLISSDNLAARTLAESSGMSYDSYIELMNDTAKKLGMIDTQYIDSTGLMSGNRSSLNDIKQLLMETEQWWIFRQAANSSHVIIDAVTTSNKRVKVVKIHGNNTNIYSGKLDIITAKTGFTTDAGKCLTMYFSMYGTKYVLVVLGAKDSIQRKLLVDRLLDITK